MLEKVNFVIISTLLRLHKVCPFNQIQIFPFHFFFEVVFLVFMRVIFRLFNILVSTKAYFKDKNIPTGQLFCDKMFSQNRKIVSEGVKE